MINLEYSRFFGDVENENDQEPEALIGIFYMACFK